MHLWIMALDLSKICKTNNVRTRMHPIILQLGNRVYRRYICDRDFNQFIFIHMFDIPKTLNRILMK